MSDPLGSILRDRVFPGMRSAAPSPDRIGVEVELLPRRGAHGGWVPLYGPGGSLDILSRGLVPAGWRPGSTASGVPILRHPAAGVISFEPGGQFEYSSRPARTFADLRSEVDGVLDRVEALYAAEGIDLVGTGVDPVWPAERIPLQLRSPRYLGMAEFLSRRDSAGRGMMCGSAAIHVHLDARADALLRWRTAHRLVPVLVAAFANSRIVAGRLSPWRSARARLWRELDPDRTDFTCGAGDPLEEYAAFARGAHFLFARDGDRFRSLDHWIGCGIAGPAEIEAHLGTLFPEVRPRGHLEIRSADALPRHWWCVPALVAAAVLYDRDTAHTCLDALPSPSIGRVALAGRRGLDDPALFEDVRTVFELVLRSARRDGTGRFTVSDVELVETYFERYPARRLTPGDEAAAGLEAHVPAAG